VVWLYCFFGSFGLGSDLFVVAMPPTRQHRDKQGSIIGLEDVSFEALQVQY
jgi:hypothetical protein